MDDLTDVAPAPPDWDPTMAKSPHPVLLTASNIDEFVGWVGSAPVSAIHAVRSAIQAGCNDDVVAILGSELNTVPISDRTRHNVLLSVLGESRRDAAIQPLERFIWNVVDVFAPAEIGRLDVAPFQIVCDFGVDFSVALRSRAVEMLAYIATPRAIEGAVRVMREHPEADVRRAAIDAYLYNSGDRSEALREVSAFARAEDQDWVGIPRRTLETNELALRERVARLTEQAPIPTHVPRPAAPTATPRREHVSAKPPEF